MPAAQYSTPGVYREDVFPAPESRLLTGVPAFLGFAGRGPVNRPRRVTTWPQFEEMFGDLFNKTVQGFFENQETFAEPPVGGYLADAVRGFFENGGSVCYVVRLSGTSNTTEALKQGLDHLKAVDAIDLVCAPDVMRASQPGAQPDANSVRAMQCAVVAHCEEHGDRLAILDALPGASCEKVLSQRQGLSGQGVGGANSALYYPWLWIPQPAVPLGKRRVPPCGHIAGVFARTDQRVGVHKAPANERLEGILDLEVNITAAQQDTLNPQGVNCVRAFPGRGVRIWGARTLSQEPAWNYINVRRLFLTAGRWIERVMADVTFEPNNFLLWLRIERELRGYFGELFHQGALKGATEEEAFYVRCDAETNPPEIRDTGTVITEVGLAPAIPSEFVVVRLIHGASGVTITRPEQGGG